MSWRSSPEAGNSPDGDLLVGLLAVVGGTRPDADVGLIGRAYDFAARAHAGQSRKTGDPYISHPVAVAAILVQAGADDQTLCAGLLHDTPQGGSYSLAALRGEFGADVTRLVTGVAALDDGFGTGQPGSRADGPATEPTPDLRVSMIKLADRLHNLRTAGPLPPATQLSKSRETLEVLVPLAASLGLDAIRTELAELAARMISGHAASRASPSGRLLAAAAALLPRTARSRWRDEWAGELAALPTRRGRAVFTARTLAGIPRLRVTLRRPPRADGTRR